jgi:type 2 lantibiotic biosynthesis protein LanM
VTTVPDDINGVFSPALGCLIEPALAGLAAQLRSGTGLAAAEREAIRDGVHTALLEAVHRKVGRLLVLELNAARVTGELAGPDESARWQDFLARAAGREFWDSLTTHYPSLLARLDTVVANRCAAALALARRFDTDRVGALRAAGRRPAPDLANAELERVSFGAGDSHRGGHTVAVLHCASGPVVYKPRSVLVDRALSGFLAAVLAGEPDGTRIRVPGVMPRDGYGWVEHAAHRYCANDDELASFYRGIGHWLAVMRLLGGVDLHAENVIACGPVPVVVDCETLFTPVYGGKPSDLGLAVDRAGELVDGTVLRTGMLPGRGIGLGWRGVDMSAVGGLPGEQPAGRQPVIVDAGSDHARMSLEHVADEGVLLPNHPSPQPVLARYWGRIIDGFVELTDRLAGLDRDGRLAPLLEPFADCPIRIVPRATEVYAEVSRMLWHPVSLHDEPAAVDRAADLLKRMAETLPAPGEPDVIAAEVAELLVGDIPFFTTTPRRGRLDGPGGTRWGGESDLVADSLRHWRSADLTLERQVIRAALVSAYLNEGWLPGQEPMGGSAAAARGDAGDLDATRRALAARIVGDIANAASRAEDGTVTWIAPVLNETGWAVQPLSPDVYGGAPGLAVLFAAYQREVARGRADPVPGLDAVLADTLRTMRKAENRRETERRTGADLRPAPPGGYIGLGSQIWAWLVLESWGVAGEDAMERARALADLMPAAVKNDDLYGVLTGMAGAIPPLLRLAGRTGEQRWLDQAYAVGERLVADAQRRPDGTACWRTERWAEGLGSFAHGATGIGWVLARLSLVTGQARFASVAGEAFAYEETLYDRAEQGWRDLREQSGTAAAWCHGAVGIGLVAWDLGRRGFAYGGYDTVDVIRRAAAATWTDGMGWNHTLCHGDLGNWELLAAALDAGLGPDGLTRAGLADRVVGSVAEHGPVVGLARDALVPGLLPGVGGIAYQLLRMHPDAGLPSMLFPAADE